MAEDNEPLLSPPQDDTLDANWQQLGNNINTKVHTGDPPRDLAFMKYSLFGMNQYPGYLEARFSEPHRGVEKLETLKQLLTQEIEKVSIAQERVIAREDLLRSYEKDSLHSEKILKMTKKELFDPQLLKVIEEGRVKAEVISGGLIEDVTERQEVFSFPIWSAEVCDLILEETDHFLEWQAKRLNERVWGGEGRGRGRRGRGIEGGRRKKSLMYEDEYPQAPGSEFLTRRLCVVDQLGAAGRHLLDLTFEEVLKPLVKALYEQKFAKTLDFRYGYIIGYSDQVGDYSRVEENKNISRQGLIPHSDDSEVTLNICLGREWTGGALAFKHQRRDSKCWVEEAKYLHKKGRAVVHLGQHIHEVENVSSGQRQVLILWSRSSDYRSRVCPCCRMFQRETETCVQGPSMN